jgi:predicted phosphate transport protein (TIGR00153 family)
MASLNSIFQYFVPKDRMFFPLFEQATANLAKMGDALIEAVNAPTIEERNSKIKLIEDLEHRGDEITHQIFLELSKNFMTPFDREDIHYLASAIDDVADYIHGSTSRILYYKIDKISDHIKKLAELIMQSTKELEKAVVELRNMKNIRKITDACVRINSIENQSDYVFDTAVAQLFEFETNAIELIKQKEVLSTLETATDKCEDAANVIESIIVKYA